MSKTTPQMSIEADTWERFKKTVENASEEVEKFMERRLDPEEETVEEIQARIKKVREQKDSLDVELASLKNKKEQIEKGAEENKWRCFDCGETGRGSPGDVERCPECRGERIGKDGEGEKS